MHHRIPRFPSRSIALAVAVLAFPIAGIAQDQDPAAIRDQLTHIFDRPAGTPIRDAQKDRLAEFVRAHQGEDLGDYGYVTALLRYLQRDPAAAAEELDRYFATDRTVPIAEHATMCGRIYLAALAEASRTGKLDVARDARRAEQAARLYPDLRTLGAVIGRIEGEPAQAIRLAAVRGALAGSANADQVDAMLQALYGGAGRRDADARPGRARPVDASAKVRDALTGQPAPALDVQAVVNGSAEFTLAAARGKVVVLDFFATWCGPCRGVVPELAALQREHPDTVQVVGATRFYGYGMDFSAPDVKLPHGGEVVRGLDRDHEIAINQTFAKVFELGYPIVFAGQDVAHEAYGVRGIPTVFVIGKDGRVLGHVVGGGDANQQTISKLVQQGLSAAPTTGAGDGSAGGTSPGARR